MNGPGRTSSRTTTSSTPVWARTSPSGSRSPPISSVIPRGTNVYVPQLAGSPAHGCFRADDTGGAIIGTHIDVFIPQTTLGGLPVKGEVMTLGPGEACPPLTAPKPVGGIALRYVAEARERDFRGSTVVIPGMGNAPGPTSCSARRASRCAAAACCRAASASCSSTAAATGSTSGASAPTARERDVDARQSGVARRRLAQPQGRADVQAPERHLVERQGREAAGVSRPVPSRPRRRARAMARRLRAGLARPARRPHHARRPRLDRLPVRRPAAAHTTARSRSSYRTAPSWPVCRPGPT